jgi:phospho-N-acetylmuramoyl-pentapeptide-transferase
MIGAWGALLSWLLIGIFLGVSRRRGWGQTVRLDGPKTHLGKDGTPTMGGLPLLLAVALVWAASRFGSAGSVHPTRSLVLMLTTLLMGAVGLLDDTLIVRARLAGRRTSTGLRAREKLALQGVIGLLFGLAASQLAPLPWPAVSPLGNALLEAVILVGSANAFNFTDGVDGLLGGVTALALLPLAASSAVGQILLGTLVGFLWFNLPKASIFMGDTGSQALGTAVAGIYILHGHTFSLPLVAIIPLAEILSVIAQVLYFRWSGGKRLLRMTPLHHHFELGGWAESKVLARFWMITALAALLTWGLIGKGL